jgi:hypothetical protein
VRRFVNRRALVVTGAVVAVLAGAVTLGASASGSAPSSFVDSLAQHLGISTAKLQDAAKAAALDQVDNALAAGRITKEQADALKARISSGDYPLSGRGFGAGPGFGAGGFGRGLFGPVPFGPPGIGLRGSLETITDYLGLSRQDLAQKLRDGQSLAQIAKAQGKSVDGLVSAIVDAAKKRLDKAVAAGWLTAEQEKNVLDRLKTMVESMVDATPPALSAAPPGFGFGFGRHMPFGRGGFVPRPLPRFRPSGFGFRI